MRKITCVGVVVLGLLAVPEVAKAQTHIVCIGDSITESFDPAFPSYRYKLSNLLANECVDFIGSRIGAHAAATPPSGWLPTGLDRFDQDHEGVSGRAAWEVALNFFAFGVPPQLAADIIFVQMGTNDIGIYNQTGAQTAFYLQNVVAPLSMAFPAAKIVVSTVIPTTNAVWNAEITNLNNIILTPGTFPAGTLIARPELGFNPAIGADTWDGAHPNASGEAKVATAFFSAMPPLNTPAGFACFKQFGMGCRYASGSTLLRPRLDQGPQRPLIGTTMTMLASELPPSSVVFGVMSDIDLVTPTVFAPPDCVALVNPTFSTMLTVNPATGTATWSFPILSTAVLGSRLFAQLAVFDAAYSVFGTSNAGMIVVGNV